MTFTNAVVGVIGLIVVAAMFWAAFRPTHHAHSAPIKKWPKPVVPDDLEFDAVKFMQITRTCCFCHADLIEGPRGGLTQNLFCSNPMCNSRFNMSPLPPDHPRSFPWGQYLGPLPDDVLAEMHARSVTKPRSLT